MGGLVVKKDTWLPQGYRDEKYHYDNGSGDAFCKQNFANKTTRVRKNVTCERCEMKIKGGYTWDGRMRS
jgi:hypothetical protein